MSETLSDEQIEAPQPRARQPRVREIDFSRPSKFTVEQQKRMERAHETFCRMITDQLAGELRMPLEFEVSNVAQHIWSSALTEAVNPSVFAVVGMRGQSNRMLLAFEQQGMMRLIVRLVGGPDEPRDPDHELTDIELALIRRLFAKLIGELSIVWNDLLGVELELLGLESALTAVQLAQPSDPSLAITIEARFRDASASMALIIPHRSIATAIESLSSGHYGDADGAEADSGAAELVRASLADVDVEVRAEIAAVQLPIEDVVALKPGDVIRFGVPATAGVMLYADEVAIHRARPGRSENARAVSVLESLEHDA